MFKDCTKNNYNDGIKRLEYGKMNCLHNSFMKIHSIYNLHYP
jgi:hypothetical protein